MSSMVELSDEEEEVATVAQVPTSSTWEDEGDGNDGEVAHSCVLITSVLCWNSRIDNQPKCCSEQWYTCTVCVNKKLTQRNFLRS